MILGWRRTLAAAALGLLAIFPQSIRADVEAVEAFVEANLIATFYHELGHAVIEIEAVPIFGQEEDAADVFSVMMIQTIYEAESAEAIAYDAALGFWAEAEERQRMSDEIPWWDVHGPDEQRFYNTVCLFFGADPKKRRAFARDMELPQDRAERCEAEYSLAEASWGPILDEMTDRGPGKTIRFKGRTDSLTAKLLKQEVDDLNALMSLAGRLTVEVEACGEANAFFDPETSTITLCREFEANLRRLARSFE